MRRAGRVSRLQVSPLSLAVAVAPIFVRAISSQLHGSLAVHLVAPVQACFEERVSLLSLDEEDSESRESDGPRLIDNLSEEEAAAVPS